MSTDHANLSPADVHIQPNVVTINDNSKTITGITYVADSLMIAPGQPAVTPPTIAQFENSFTITLQAGRVNNTAIATDFNDACGGADHEYAPSRSSEGNSPSKLNFYFAVHIAYDSNGNSGSVLVYLGQESYGSLMDPANWWMGGSCIANNSGPSSSTIKLATVLDLSGNQDTFVIG